MLGGVLWASGKKNFFAAKFFSDSLKYKVVRFFFFAANAFSVQIMNRLGMGLANLLWNTLSCLMGWATSRWAGTQWNHSYRNYQFCFRFGLLGLRATTPVSPGLNYLGIAILIAGYLFTIIHFKKVKFSLSFSFLFVWKGQKRKMRWYAVAQNTNTWEKLTCYPSCGLWAGKGGFCKPKSKTSSFLPAVLLTKQQQNRLHIVSGRCWSWKKQSRMARGSVINQGTTSASWTFNFLYLWIGKIFDVPVFIELSGGILGFLNAHNLRHQNLNGCLQN